MITVTLLGASFTKQHFFLETKDTSVLLTSTKYSSSSCKTNSNISLSLQFFRCVKSRHLWRVGVSHHLLCTLYAQIQCVSGVKWGVGACPSDKVHGADPALPGQSHAEIRTDNIQRKNCCRLNSTLYKTRRAVLRPSSIGCSHADGNSYKQGTCESLSTWTWTGLSNEDLERLFLEGFENRHDYCWSVHTFFGLS